MDFTSRFILFQSVIILPLIIGIFFKKRLKNPRDTMKSLIMVNLVFVEPTIVMWSIWGLDLHSELLYLPLAGLLMVIAGLALGKAMSPLLNLGEKSRATFIISSSIANHGFTMGGFICYLLLGEKGLGLSFIFLSYFIPYLLIVVFPYASLASSGETHGFNIIADFIKSPRNMPLYAMIAAIVIRIAGFDRPEIYFPIDPLLMISIGMYYLSLGMSFSLRDMGSFKRDSFFLCMIKFLMIPLLTVIALYFINIDASIEAIILIESFMPAAVYSVMSSVLFGLDERRASAMFVFNTIAFLLFILPMIFLFYKTLHSFIS